MRYIYILALLAALLAFYLPLSLYADLGCITDEECARHCPPPNDDPDCDGGPELEPTPIIYKARYPEIIGVRG